MDKLCEKCYGCNRQEDERFRSVADCIDYQEARRELKDIVDKVNERLGNYRQIKL